MTTRVFIVGKSGEVRRFPSARYVRLHDRTSNERLPERSNEWVQFAEVLVELEDRKPLRIVSASFSRLKLGPDGSADRKRLDRSLRLAMESIVSPRDPGDPGLLRGTGVWAQKETDEFHRWTPMPFQARTIRTLALAK